MLEAARTTQQSQATPRHDLLASTHPTVAVSRCTFCSRPSQDVQSPIHAWNSRRLMQIAYGGSLWLSHVLVDGRSWTPGTKLRKDAQTAKQGLDGLDRKPYAVDSRRGFEVSKQACPTASGMVEDCQLHAMQRLYRKPVLQGRIHEQVEPPPIGSISTDRPSICLLL
jgi:hypothetical protein